ncbi:hypothetical protein OROHE_007786 [Orobanche hederae]
MASISSVERTVMGQGNLGRRGGDKIAISGVPPRGKAFCGGGGGGVLLWSRAIGAARLVTNRRPYGSKRGDTGVGQVQSCQPIQVHPCGQYRKNTVVGILQAEHDLGPLFRILLIIWKTIHRLDRLVSGLLILARSTSRADIFRQQIESGEVKKQYIARVVGVFPENEQVANANVNYNAREGKSTVEVENGSNGNNTIKGKAACTRFTRISTNGEQSIVSCEPITGRTHQIRVHLQFLGHPIANDMLYLSECVPNRCSEGMSADRAAANSTLSPKSNHCEEIHVPHSTDEPFDDFNIDRMCTNCPNLAPKG